MASKKRTMYFWERDIEWLRKVAINRNFKLITVIEEMVSQWRDAGAPMVAFDALDESKLRVTAAWDAELLSWFLALEGRSDHTRSVPELIATAVAWYRAREIATQRILFNPKTGSVTTKPAGEDYPDRTDRLAPGNRVGQ